MFNVLNGEKIFIIANVETSGLNNAVVARKDSGILKPGDLEGKRVGFTPGTTSDFFEGFSADSKRHESAVYPARPPETRRGASRPSWGKRWMRFLPGTIL